MEFESAKKINVLLVLVWWYRERWEFLIGIWRFDYGSVRNHWPYPNHDQDEKPKSGTSCILQSPISWLQEHGYFFWIFKIKIESQKLEPVCLKDQCSYPNHDQDANPSQEPTASSNTLNQNIKYMDVFCTFKISSVGQNFDQESTKAEETYPYHD